MQVQTTPIFYKPRSAKFHNGVAGPVSKESGHVRDSSAPDTIVVVILDLKNVKKLQKQNSKTNLADAAMPRQKQVLQNLANGADM